MPADEGFDQGSDIYSQLANLFPCSIEGPIRVQERRQPGGVGAPAPASGGDAAIALSPAGEGRPPTGEELKQILDQAFRGQLSQAGFSLRGASTRSYIAYNPLKPARRCPTGFCVAFRGFEFRFIDVDGNVYLAVDPHVVMDTTVTIQDLIAHGLEAGDLQGFHVLIGADGTGATAYLARTTQNGSNVICTCQTAHGETLQLPSVEVRPESRPDLLVELASKAGLRCEATAAHRELSYLDSTKPSFDRLDRTVAMVRFLADEGKGVFPLAIGDARVRVDPRPLPVRGSGFLAGGVLREGSLSFDVDDASAVAPNTYRGLQRYGPYEKGAQDIQVALLAPRQRMDDLKRLLSTLMRGSERMPGGMEHFFWCKLLLKHEEPIENETLQSYQAGCERLLARHRSMGDIDMALVFVPRTPEWRYNTPYYSCKSMLTGGGVACQMISHGCLSNLSWSVANVASAIYAKCRGVPWALADERSPFEAVIGVAVRQNLGMNRSGAAQGRYMGYANVFDEWGRWLFFQGTVANVAQPGQGAEQLEAVLRGAMAGQIAQRGVAPSRIGVHYWKRFGREEKDRAIAAIVATAGENVQICFISINDDHPYRLYDRNVEDGAFPRGGYAVIHPHRFLLCTTGDTSLSRKRIGTPRLLDISFECYPEDFVGPEEIAEHILGLTKLDYATLTPLVREPVTLMFARQIAALAAAMTEQEWNGVAQPGVPVATKRRMFFL